MGGSARRTSPLEAAVFFGAMLVVLATEAACVYWLPLMGTARGPAANVSSIAAPWTTATLPQCWMLGALIMLIYRIILLSTKPASPVEASENRCAFVRLWRWTAIVGCAQMLAVFLDRIAHGGL